jgi:hypothetical protein
MCFLSFFEIVFHGVFLFVSCFFFCLDSQMRPAEGRVVQCAKIKHSLVNASSSMPYTIHLSGEDNKNYTKGKTNGCVQLTGFGWEHSRLNASIRGMPSSPQTLPYIYLSNRSNTTNTKRKYTVQKKQSLRLPPPPPPPNHPSRSANPPVNPSSSLGSVGTPLNCGECASAKSYPKCGTGL